MEDKKGWIIAAIVVEVVTLVLMYMTNGSIEISWMLIFPLIVVGLIYAVVDTIKKRNSSGEYVPPRLEKEVKDEKSKPKDKTKETKTTKKVKNTEDDDFL